MLLVCLAFPAQTEQDSDGKPQYFLKNNLAILIASKIHKISHRLIRSVSNKGKVLIYR